AENEDQGTAPGGRVDGAGSGGHARYGTPNRAAREPRSAGLLGCGRVRIRFLAHVTALEPEIPGFVLGIKGFKALNDVPVLLGSPLA
ncbi:hypothetical protein DF186_18730, partial [Enterococcus hirae]